VKRTTMALDERLIERIREKARREGKPFQDCANELLRLGLEASAQSTTPPPPLPTFSLGEALVDIADREALYQVLDSE
jgi:hypothetical protein